MKIDLSTELTDSEAGELGDKLDAFNAAESGFDDEQSLRISARDETGRLVGGLTGVTGLQWLYIHILWVEVEYRREKVGTRLVEEAERMGRVRGCRSACLMTFSFQAVEFYRKLGYDEFGNLPDYPEGHSLHFMKKPIRDA